MLISVKFGAQRGSGRRAGSATTPRPRGGQDRRGLLAAAAGHRPHRHLPAGAARSPRCRSRRRSARSPSSSRPATCATSGSPRSAPRPIRRAAAAHPICDLQIEYSLISRGIEAEILPACRELGIGITAYGVLSRGLISGHWTPTAGSHAGDFRSRAPRFQGENLERNLALVEQLRAVAEAQGASVAQVAIAWVLSRGEDIVPLIGARTRERLNEALGALELSLSQADLRSIEEAMPARRRRGRSLSRAPDGPARQRALARLDRHEVDRDRPRAGP